MNFNLLKRLFIVIVFIFTCISASKNEISIQSIANLGKYKTILCSKLKCASVLPNTVKKFGSSFHIPFVSIKRNLKEFVKDIPFVPSHALKLSTSTGIFFIWRNESGIVYAPDPSNNEAVIAWKLKILLDKKNNRNINLSNLALEIDKDGNLEMCQQRALPEEQQSARKI